VFVPHANGARLIAHRHPNGEKAGTELSRDLVGGNARRERHETFERATVDLELQRLGVPTDRERVADAGDA
jgi:hypothetical protein